MESTETPAEKVMRQWYQGKLAERLMQMAHLAQNRSLLRRGARKMQDGTLGQVTDDAEEDPVNIHIGDVVVTEDKRPTTAEVATEAKTTTALESPTATTPLWQKVLVVWGLMSAGAGVTAAIPFALSLLEKPAEQQTFVDTDTDTQYELRLGTGK